MHEPVNERPGIWTQHYSASNVMLHVLRQTLPGTTRSSIDLVNDSASSIVKPVGRPVFACSWTAVAVDESCFENVS